MKQEQKAMKKTIYATRDAILRRMNQLSGTLDPSKDEDKISAAVIQRKREKLETATDETIHSVMEEEDADHYVIKATQCRKNGDVNGEEKALLKAMDMDPKRADVIVLMAKLMRWA